MQTCDETNNSGHEIQGATAHMFRYRLSVLGPQFWPYAHNFDLTVFKLEMRIAFLASPVILLTGRKGFNLGFVKTSY